MESEILGFGIRKTDHGIRYSTSDWNLEFKFHCQSPAWNPESNTVLDTLSWGNMYDTDDKTTN